jgi:integrase
MPRLKVDQVPKKCRDRNQCYSWHNGKRTYHGVWGTPEADENYRRFKIAILENPIPALPMSVGDGVFVSELAAGYLDTIENSPMHPSHISHFRQVIGYLVETYGDLAVNEFSPKKLKVVRDQLVKAVKPCQKTGKTKRRFCRKMVNDYIGRIKRIFAWGVEEELVHADVYNAIRIVKNLPKRTPGTFDHPEREDVPEWVIALTLPFLAPVVAAMVVIQYLTGMRPSEVFNMRVGDIDRSRKNGLWYYTPESHKTEEQIGKKPIPLGKPEQKLIAPYLEDKKPEAAVFSPRTAMRERAAKARENRKSKLTPSQQERDAKRAEKNTSKVREFYDRSSYRNTIRYAIIKGNRHGVKIPHWSPYLLRNSAATAIELEHGLDEAQAQLGHTTADMTKRYSAAQLKQREKLAHSRMNPFEK